MFKFLASAAIPTLCAVGLAAPAQADGEFIVIAASDTTHSVETATGGVSPGLGYIEGYAVSHCAERRGAADCRVLAEGQGGCVALSDNGQSFVGAWGPTRQAAAAEAMANSGVNGAVVDITRCASDPGLAAAPVRNTMSGRTSFWSQ